MSIGSLSIEEFLARLGSSDPTPGGGALAALEGAMAAAMLRMVCNLTVGRARYAGVQDETARIEAEAAELQQRLLHLADADAEAYLAVRDAYRLPREDQAQTTARSSAIQLSMRRATEVPTATIERAREVLDLALRSAATGNISALGDVAVAGHLAVAAARGAASQVDLNLRQIEAADFVEGIQRRTSQALEDLDSALRACLETIEARTAD